MPLSPENQPLDQTMTVAPGDVGLVYGGKTRLPGETFKATKAHADFLEKNGNALRGAVKPEEALEQAPPSAPRGQDKAPFSHDPEDLKGKKLEDLNAMLAEESDSVEAQTTIKDAVEMLSQNFVD